MTSPDDKLLRVLHVDECAEQRCAVRGLLTSEERFEVDQPRTPEEFVAALAAGSHDLILCELAPWGLPPLEVLRRVTELGSKNLARPAVVLTSRGSEYWAAQAIKQGASDYLSASQGIPPGLSSQLRVIASQWIDPLAEVANGLSSEKPQRLLQHSLHLLFVGGFDGYIKRWNPLLQEMLDYSRDEMMTIPLTAIVHPDDLGRAFEIGSTLASGKSTSPAEMRVRRRDGSYRWFLWYAVPCLEEQIYFATGQDITAQKEIEERLRESQARFQLIASATNEAVWDWDLRTNHVWRNESYFQVFGRPDDLVDGTIEWWRQRVHPDDRQRILDAMPPPVVDGQQKWVMEYRLRRADGEYAHVYDRGFVIFGSDGRAVRMVGSIMDISELKNAEDRLRESEERFRLAARAASDAIWDWDFRTETVWRGEGFQTLFGYQPADIGNDFPWWLGRIHVDDQANVMRQIHLAQTKRSRQCAFEYRFRRADGTYAHVFDRGFVMWDDEGVPVRMVGSMMDISERRRAEETAAMQRAELAHIARVSTMGEIATGLAHELNQPLTAISNYAESCARALAAPSPANREKVGQWIEKIANNTQRAAEMIRRLRGFTRKSEPQRSTVEVSELVGEVIELMEAETRLQNARVRWIAPATTHVTVDRIQVQQVLVNLLRNAYEAMAKNPLDQRQVTIEAVCRGSDVEIAVADLGEGIAAEHCHRVFDAFFTNKPDGVGVGLAISRSIVEDHGGSLWLTPNAARGVTFHFTLPLSTPERAVAPAVSRTAGRVRPLAVSESGGEA